MIIFTDVDTDMADMVPSTRELVRTENSILSFLHSSPEKKMKMERDVMGEKRNLRLKNEIVWDLLTLQKWKKIF